MVGMESKEVTGRRPDSAGYFSWSMRERGLSRGMEVLLAEPARDQEDPRFALKSSSSSHV